LERGTCSLRGVLQRGPTSDPPCISYKLGRDDSLVASGNGGGDGMYLVDLDQAHFPAQGDLPVLETTVGGVLRARADATPGAEALVEADVGGVLRRRWTYAALAADAERLASALLSRYGQASASLCGRPTFPSG